MNIFVVRHGQTDWNVRDVLQGTTNVDLNATGIKQANEIAENLYNIDFDAIYCSPLNRTLDTAIAINSGRNLPIIKDKRLVEREFGDYEGKPGNSVDFKKYWNYTDNFSDNNVESIQVFFARVKSFLEEIINKFGNTNKNILIVTHNGVNLAISSLIEGLPENIFSFNLSPCEYKIFKNPILQKNNIKFSIIIPAYNVQDFIGKALNSVFNQTYANYEILVIDDCSNDNTYNKLKEYNNIKIFQTTENSRQGGARNIGLDNCLGEYVIFLDADDTLYDFSVLEKLNKCIKKNNNPDIIYTGMKISGKEDKLLIPSEENCKKDYRLAKCKWVNATSICWKNELLQKNNIRFPEKIRYEDVYFNFLGIEKAKTYAYDNFIFYHYHNRTSGTTTTTYTLDQTADTIKLIRKLFELVPLIDKSSLPLLKQRIDEQSYRAYVRLERVVKQHFKDIK